MRDCENLDDSTLLAINDRKRESLEDETSRSIIARRPLLRRFPNQLQGIINCSAEPHCGRLAALHIPPNCRLQFGERLGMNLNVLGGH